MNTNETLKPPQVGGSALNVELERAHDQIRKAVENKLQFIEEHKEELLTAFIAKTGFYPDECELCIRTEILEFSEHVTAYWVRRKEVSDM
jgi:hypothetical protein